MKKKVACKWLKIKGGRALSGFVGP